MKYEIDLRGVRNKAQFHDRIQSAIPCPDYYGRNLDALYDVLTERGEEWELIFHGYEDFSHDMPGYGAALRELCKEAMEGRPDLKISFPDGCGSEHDSGNIL